MICDVSSVGFVGAAVTQLAETKGVSIYDLDLIDRTLTDLGSAMPLITTSRSMPRRMVSFMIRLDFYSLSSY